MKRKWLAAALLFALAVFDVGYLCGARPDPDAPVLADISLGRAVQAWLPGGDVLVRQSESVTTVSHLEVPAMAGQTTQGTIELTVLEYGAPAKGTPVRFRCEVGGFSMPIGQKMTDQTGRIEQALQAGAYRIDVLYGRAVKSYTFTVSAGQRTALLVQRD